MYLQKKTTPTVLSPKNETTSGERACWLHGESNAKK